MSRGQNELVCHQICPEFHLVSLATIQTHLPDHNISLLAHPSIIEKKTRVKEDEEREKENQKYSKTEESERTEERIMKGTEERNERRNMREERCKEKKREKTKRETDNTEK
jgi:hypothetical protein